MYGVSHGEALGFLLESVCEVMGSEVAKELNIPKLNVGTFSINDVSEEALTYSKYRIHLKTLICKMLKKFIETQ